MDDLQKRQSGAMDWDDYIEDDGLKFIVLPEGDYNFIVTNFERGRFPGSAKLPPCPKAALTLQVKTDAGVASVRTDLLLCRDLEWKTAQFFRCIGQKKQGERVRMNWNAVIGAKGCAHFKPRTYMDKNGYERQANDVDRFYDWNEDFFDGEDSMTFTELPDDEELPFF